MREIKFKAWVKSMKRFYSISGFMEKTDRTHGYKVMSLFFGDGFGTWGADDVVLMQFTGLKDKNGKEIYEGDILRSWYSRDTAGKDIVYMIFPVEHETLDYKGFSGFQIEFLKNASIIGTIYENPELLNQGKGSQRSVASKD